MGGENLRILSKCINDDDDVDTDHDHSDDHIEKLAHEEVEGVLVELVVDVLQVVLEEHRLLLLSVLYHSSCNKDTIFSF